MRDEEVNVTKLLLSNYKLVEKTHVADLFLYVVLNSSAKEHLADALAIRGDEGRGRLR